MSLQLDIIRALTLVILEKNVYQYQYNIQKPIVNRIGNNVVNCNNCDNWSRLLFLLLLSLEFKETVGLLTNPKKSIQ